MYGAPFERCCWHFGWWLNPFVLWKFPVVSETRSSNLFSCETNIVCGHCLAASQPPHTGNNRNVDMQSWTEGTSVQNTKTRWGLKSFLTKLWKISLSSGLSDQIHISLIKIQYKLVSALYKSFHWAGVCNIRSKDRLTAAKIHPKMAKNDKKNDHFDFLGGSI